MSTLVGRQAPDFTVAAVSATGQILDKFHFATAVEGKHAVVIFYPLDFTFVCPSELIALDKQIDEFTQRNVVVITVSVDSQFTHHAWRNTPITKGGIGPVRYTMAADVGHTICRAYGVEHPEAAVAFRATFILDQQGIVRAQLVNDLPLGRSISEIIRLIDALQFTEKHGEVCPANWNKGKATIKATQAGIAEFLQAYEEQL